MLTPDQVNTGDDDRNKRQQEAIEKYIDQRLAAGFLRFPSTRGGWFIENIEAVLAKYRKAGWVCSFRSGTGFEFERATK